MADEIDQRARYAEGGSEPKQTEGTDYLDVARQAFRHSTDYLDANLREGWERSIRSFNSRHPAGSKYESDAYKHRSKLFRPKTRANMRRAEAAAAAAFFATQDVVNITAVDDNDPKQQASALLMQEVLNHRLQKSIKWFRTLMGAYQDARLLGFCVSKQHWLYEEKTLGPPEMQPVLDETGQPVVDPMTGVPEMQTIPNVEVIKDQLALDLHPPENARFDAAADWLDPVNSSPYFIMRHPMFVVDVKRRMNAVDPKTGVPPWTRADDDAILRARDSDDFDSTRQARENKRVDPVSESRPVNDFDIVWVHENFIRIDGEDTTYWTLGTEALLTDPVPTKEVYRATAPDRPYRMGVAILESHRAIPTSHVELSHPVQAEINEVANTRMDNVRMSLNGRYFVRNGAGVDLESLRRNSPGSFTLMNNPETDIRWERAPDVTRSAYEEQDRLTNDFDEIAGAFSPASVQSNRELSDTATGMALISNSASSISEYDLRIFAETWVEPVLRDCVRLIQHYETDQNIIALGAEKAELFQKFGIDEATDELLEGELTVTVNVGIGSTDPVQQLERFAFGFRSFMEISMGLAQMYGPTVMQSPGMEQIGTEIFGKLGYKDGKRFLDFEPPPDPEKEEMAMQLEQMGQELQSAQMEVKSKDTEHKLKLIETSSKIDLEREKMAVEKQKLIGETFIQNQQMAMQQQQAGMQAKLDMRRFGLEALKAKGEREMGVQGQQFEREKFAQQTGLEKAKFEDAKTARKETAEMTGRQRSEDQQMELARMAADGKQIPDNLPVLPAASQMAGLGDGVTQLAQVMQQMLQQQQQQMAILVAKQDQQQAQIVQAIGQMAQAMAAPKQLVRDEQGRAIGVRPATSIQ